MAAFLPLELITEILTKLPVKSLNRFKCVSKTWNSIITSSKFIKQHLHQTLISNTNIIIIISSNNSLFSSASSAVELRFDIVNHPLTNLPVKIAGSVHGVLFIVDSSKETVCLFNPSNKTQRLIPPAPALFHLPNWDDFEVVEAFGFGYDSVTDDYKVVRLVQRYSELWGLFREASVYSMRNNSWVSVNDDTVPHTLHEISAIAVDDTLWFLLISADNQSVFKCFHLRTRMFLLVDFPKLDTYPQMILSLRNLRGCLCLVVNYRTHRVGCDHTFFYAAVWEMKEYKWVKLFSIRKNEIPKDCIVVRLITYSKDMKSVLIEVDNNWYGWYDLVTKQIERVPVQGLRLEDSPYLAYTYVESLVSVANNKVVSKEGTTRPKKTIKKDDFLSSGFKLKL